jgi:hypothetical protein
MIRHLFTCSVALSLVVCVATGVLWVRSHRAGDEIHVGTPTFWSWGQCQYGGILIYLSPGPSQSGPVPLSHQTYDLDPDSILEERVDFPIVARKINLNFAGFHFWYGTWGGSNNYAIIIRLWQVVLVCTLLIAAVAGVRHSRRRRLCLGLCSACGYDLRASKERCPECGTPVVQSVETTA